MKSQRLLILVFAAALTAGTCAANPVLNSVPFNFVGGPGGFGTNQTGSLSIDGIVECSFSGTTNSCSGTMQEADGWHTVAIDYKENASTNGTPGLTLDVNSSYVLSSDLGSLDSNGIMVNGLQGSFFTLTGVSLMTIYGTSQGPNLHYSVGTTPWSGSYDSGAFTFATTSTFEEQLSGYIYFGTGTPLLTDIPGQQQSGGTAPEPASWWLAGAALPLMLISKLRRRARRSE
jgi:hypothetical protein